MAASAPHSGNVNGLRSGGAPDVSDRSQSTHPAFIPNSWVRHGWNDDDAKPEPLAVGPTGQPDQLRLGYTPPLQHGDNTRQLERERVAYVDGERLLRDLRTNRLSPDAAPFQEAIPAPSVPHWGRNYPHRRTTLAPTEFRVHVRDDYPHQVNHATNLGNAVVVPDVSGYYPVAGMAPRGYTQPATWAPDPDPNGANYVTVPDPVGNGAPRVDRRWR